MQAIMILGVLYNKMCLHNNSCIPFLLRIIIVIIRSIMKYFIVIIFLIKEQLLELLCLWYFGVYKELDKCFSYV